jgi:nucleotide-binding universal stress UspA family protein
MERLLVPIDGSEGARRAAAFAAKQARATGAEVTLVYVYESASPAALNFVGSAAGLDQGQAKVAQASFEAAKQSMDGFDVRDHLVEIGQPADTIVELAARLDASQIIMGSRGLSPVKELLLGSVSDRVVRNAHCPVTIVR